MWLATKTGNDATCVDRVSTSFTFASASRNFITSCILYLRDTEAKLSMRSDAWTMMATGIADHRLAPLLTLARKLSTHSLRLTDRTGMLFVV